MADTNMVMITQDAAKGLDSLPFLKTFAAEGFFFTAAVLMLLIHVGFMAYEGGCSRSKNLLATMLKNMMTVSTVGLSFFFFGWWVYNAFPFWPVTGPLLGPWTNPDTLTDLQKTAFAVTQASYPWSDAMAPNKIDEFTGVFWMVFALFAMTTSSIVSGACIERIKIGAYFILSILLGSFLWVVAAAWGWNFFGWMTSEWGFHDFGCAVVVHCVSGMFTLGVLINLGPRIGKFINGVPQVILPHNISLTMVGLMLIYVGFFFFLACCLVYLPGYSGIVNIYGAPYTLASLAVNTTLALAAGFAGAYVSSKADPFFTTSGGLTGIIAVAAGMDLYHPALCIVIAFIAAWIMPKVALFIETPRHRRRGGRGAGAWRHRDHQRHPARHLCGWLRCPDRAGADQSRRTGRRRRHHRHLPRLPAGLWRELVAQEVGSPARDRRDGRSKASMSPTSGSWPTPNRPSSVRSRRA